MNKKNMIAWFIQELELSHQDVVELFNSYLDDDPENYTEEQVQQMMQGKRQWPEGTWDALRVITSNQIGSAQIAAKEFNKTKASVCSVSANELSRPFGKLKLIMICTLLRGDVPVLVE